MTNTYNLTNSLLNTNSLFANKHRTLSCCCCYCWFTLFFPHFLYDFHFRTSMNYATVNEITREHTKKENARMKGRRSITENQKKTTTAAETAKK